MDKLTYYIVDVFAIEEKYTGNQLAVFTKGAENLSDRQMQRIAKEINYSETTFVISSEITNGGYDVRIFTPAQEIPFAGHPTLGTAFIIQSEIIRQPVTSITLNLKVGQIPVNIETQNSATIWWMQQKPPTFHQTLSPDAIAPVLNLETADIDTRFPIQEVSTGIPFIIVPLKTLADLKRAKINREKYFDLIRTTDAKCILIFSPEPYHPDSHISVRMFADYLGVPEDPATGSANGCLAGYLVQHKYFGTDNINLRADQGYEIGRPSLLLLKAEDQVSEISVFIGGKVTLVAQGEFV
ncbi:MAG TPA: PhzF family phenazine biosynthesis protein [Oscillatoriaceae cyanobacterium M33_DOE_052]|uniref:PhzF family phenazine biosynthesis protein n=1 Tax=Planktothricoides sp. SpSt-374 TaxID=2282167 RepID=A0A7C3VPA1_9CYAN|nr:PhzF family phenazine biosynthesis protein [Oscillatoriaceae cyanobacterium M33_DOE_052]